MIRESVTTQVANITPNCVMDMQSWKLDSFGEEQAMYNSEDGPAFFPEQLQTTLDTDNPRTRDVRAVDQPPDLVQQLQVKDHDKYESVCLSKTIPANAVNHLRTEIEHMNELHNPVPLFSWRSNGSTVKAKKVPFVFPPQTDTETSTEVDTFASGAIGIVASSATDLDDISTELCDPCVDVEKSTEDDTESVTSDVWLCGIPGSPSGLRQVVTGDGEDTRYNVPLLPSQSTHLDLEDLQPDAERHISPSLSLAGQAARAPVDITTIPIDSEAGKEMFEAVDLMLWNGTEYGVYCTGKLDSAADAGIANIEVVERLRLPIQKLDRSRKHVLTSVCGLVEPIGFVRLQFKLAKFKTTDPDKIYLAELYVLDKRHSDFNILLSPAIMAEMGLFRRLV